jgi:competence protein ComEC
VRRLDFVLLTHAHPDHCGGIPAVLRHLDVGQLLISPRRFRGECAQRILAARPERITVVRMATNLSIDQLRVLATPAIRDYKRAPENNSSIVTTVEAASRRIVLTGDIESEAEADHERRIGPVEVLKIAHHGSRSSTTSAFLDAVGPRLAVISCGRNNLFGHPHAVVVDRLAARRIRTLRTDRNGSIEITIAGRNLLVTPEIDTPR